MGKSFWFCAGFAIGVSVGWVLGILSAPQSGKDTRDGLEQKAIELRARAEEVAGQVRDRVRTSPESAADAG